MINFASPLFLSLLPMPWLIFWIFPASQLHLIHALPLPFYRFIVERLNKLPHVSTQVNSVYFFTFIWMLLVVALAGPQWVGQTIRLTQQGRNIFLALDVSGSMDLPDMTLNHKPTTRLTVVKQAAENFIQARPDDHIGLILFGTQAYLQTPLTYDHASILKRIQDASVGLAGKTTSIGDAIGLSIKKLQTTPENGRVIILLTDGASNSGLIPPLKAAELAKSEHIKIYTIGLSASEESSQTMANLFISMQGGADLDEETLKEIATLTGGQYFRATNPASLHKIYQKIDLLEATRQETTPLRPQEQYYPWILLICNALFSLWIYRYIKRNQT